MTLPGSELGEGLSFGGGLINELGLVQARLLRGFEFVLQVAQFVTRQRDGAPRFTASPELESARLGLGGDIEAIGLVHPLLQALRLGFSFCA